MNANKFGIEMIYIENTFSKSELSELRKALADHGLMFIAHKRSPYINASIDFFVPFLQILFSPEMTAVLMQGVMINAFYDAIKGLLLHIYHKFYKSPVKKLQGGEIKEEPANVHVILGNNRLVLPMDVDDSKFQYVVDKFFDTAKVSFPKETTYIFYSASNGKIVAKTEREIIQDEFEKQQNDQRH